ncbi:methyltransferase [Colwellia psychrerythraea]|uniref:Methyltransferase type 11 n=1 Tax=Colwellia psychrerythraea TaxID=28229 RepID=A0A099L040_COLPS|nr:methyltransferase [Colwellia psychrerythraea]KGJ96216.1 Methyltransferase type 11 [Colwellia psychrerythraea]
MSDTNESKQAHWDTIFSAKQDAELGWFEDDCSQTLSFLKNTAISASSTLFLAGAGTSKLVDELINTDANLIINDISAKALEQLSQRLNNTKCQYLHHDLGHSFDKGFDKGFTVDVWIDRAVLHFLLTEKQITHYFENLKSTVKCGGYVLLAEFSNAGATHCAGLAVHRYSENEMQVRLGDNFELINSKQYTFVNPFKQERPYIYALFKRRQ